jgi:hypothetical protein
MKASAFDVLSRVQDHLKKSGTNTRVAVKPDEMLKTSEQKQHNAEAQRHENT